MPCVVSPYWIGGAAKVFQEIAPPYKPYPKGEVDGKQVNIPVPIIAAMGRRRRLGWPGVGYPGLST